MKSLISSTDIFLKYGGSSPDLRAIDKARTIKSDLDTFSSIALLYVSVQIHPHQETTLHIQILSGEIFAQKYPGTNQSCNAIQELASALFLFAPTPVLLEGVFSSRSKFSVIIESRIYRLVLSFHKRQTFFFVTFNTFLTFQYKFVNQ